MEAIARLGPSAIALALGVAFIGGAIGAIVGMGSGLIVTLFITPIIGAKAVVQVISTMMLVTNASRVWVCRDALVRERILPIAAVAIPASALGALLYVRLDGVLVQGLIGAILVLSIPLRRWMEDRQIAPSRGHVVAVSGLFGFLSSLIVGAGILLIPILLGLGLAGPALIATDAAISVMVNLAKVIFFGSLDALTIPLVVVALSLGVAGIPGTWAGSWVVRRTSIRLHTWLIETVIVVGGAALVWGAVRA